MLSKKAGGVGRVTQDGNAHVFRKALSSSDASSSHHPTAVPLSCVPASGEHSTGSRDCMYCFRAAGRVLENSRLCWGEVWAGGLGGGGVGGAEDAQAQVSAYHKLFRRNAGLRRSTEDRRQSARRAVNRSADPFLIRSNGRTGKYARPLPEGRFISEAFRPSDSL